MNRDRMTANIQNGGMDLQQPCAQWITTGQEETKRSDPNRLTLTDPYFKYRNTIHSLGGAASQPPSCGGGGAVGHRELGGFNAQNRLESTRFGTAFGRSQRLVHTHGHLHAATTGAAAWVVCWGGTPVLARHHTSRGLTCGSSYLKRAPGMHWKGGRYTPHLHGAQPKPSHCPPNAKCRLQWHLYPTKTAPNRFGNLLQPPV